MTRTSAVPHVSAIDAQNTAQSTRDRFAEAFLRPFSMLFKEPICLLISLHVGITYSTLYGFFASYAVVRGARFERVRHELTGPLPNQIFQLHRHLDPAKGSLPFLGVFGGIVVSLPICWLLQRRYLKLASSSPSGIAPPEARLVSHLRPWLVSVLAQRVLPPAQIMSKIGTVSVCISLIAFAWTTKDSFPTAVSAAMSVPFGLGLILVFCGSLGYLLDTYTEHASSVMAANCILRRSGFPSSSSRSALRAIG